MAKHGNRSASGKVGSADVLEGLGLNLKAPLQAVVDAIGAAGVTFLFAPAWHPALVNLAPLRRSLGVRTVFNLLGPLVNPLRPQAQVLGVASSELLDPMAGALQQLGLERAIVVHGAGGLDEASLAGANQLRLIESGQITAFCPAGGTRPDECTAEALRRSLAVTRRSWKRCCRVVAAGPSVMPWLGHRPGALVRPADQPAPGRAGGPLPGWGLPGSGSSPCGRLAGGDGQ